MRTLHTLVAVLLSVCAQAAEKAQWPPEPLIEMRVQFAPTAFPGAGATYLVYELRLTNLSKQQVSVQRSRPRTVRLLRASATGIAARESRPARKARRRHCAGRKLGFVFRAASAFRSDHV